MKRSWKITIAVILVLGAIAYLGYTGFQSATVYYLTVDELLERGSAAVGAEIRVRGVVVGDSINWDDQSIVLSFDLQGEQALLPVRYEGIIPDNFVDGTEVTVGGYLTPEGVFAADELILSCPSKYEPEVEGEGS